MPKIISGAKEKILDTAKRQLFESGYPSLSLRSIAKECQLGVGTIYNYFSSKEELIASIMLEDWKKTLQQMDQHVNTSLFLENGFLALHSDLLSFCEIYKSLFEQAHSSSYITPSRHDLLLRQLSERIDALYEKFNQSEDKEFSTIMAELMLISSAKNTIHEIQFKKMIQRIIRKENKL